MTELSKTKAKRARRLAEQQAFLAERRAMQISMLEQNYALGVKLFEDNKEKLSEDDLKLIETEMAKQREVIDKAKAEWGIDEPRSEG